MKIKILFFFLLLIHSVSYACSVNTAYTNGYNLPNVTTAVNKNINRYEGSSIESHSSAHLTNATIDIFRVFNGCPVNNVASKYLRILFGNIHSPAVTYFGNDIYRLNSQPTVGIKVEFGDAPAASTLKVLNLSEKDIYEYDGDSHGVKVKVTLYILPKPENLTNYPPNITITNLQIATITLRRKDNNVMIATAVPVNLNTRITINESTCSLNNSEYTITLPPATIRILGAVNVGTSLTTNNTATLNINCPHLINGNGREIKAYITDALDQASSSNVLKNTTGNGYATGVGVRLQDQNNNIISFDPNQSKSLNKWTFGLMGTSQTIQQIIKANYVRTASTVTAGAVQSRAYLNIVYD